MTSLPNPYVIRATLSNDLVAKEAIDIFSDSSLDAREARFQRVFGTELMYQAYYVPEHGNRSRPLVNNDFDLVDIAEGLPELKKKLTPLTSRGWGPNLRVIKPSKSKLTFYAIFSQQL